MKVGWSVVLYVAVPLVLAALGIVLYVEVFHNALSADPGFVSFVGAVVVAPLSLIIGVVNGVHQRQRESAQSRDSLRARRDSAFDAMLNGLRWFLESPSARALEEKAYQYRNLNQGQKAQAQPQELVQLSIHVVNIAKYVEGIASDDPDRSRYIRMARGCLNANQIAAVSEYLMRHQPENSAAVGVLLGSVVS